MKKAAVLLLFLLNCVAPLSGGRAEDIMRIAAVVNTEVISVYDLVARLHLIISSSNLPDSPELRQRLAPQVLRGLIDERLKLQEAKRLNIKVNDDEFNGAVADIERRNNIPAGQFKEFLAARGIDAGTIFDQIRSTIAWGKVVQQRIRPRIEITDDEVREAMDRIRANANQPRFAVSEIFLAVDTPEQEDSVRSGAERIVEQINKGANFGTIARQFSQSATAAVGGDMGWIEEGQLDTELDNALRKMQPGQIAGPIRTAGGYYILALRDKRIPGASAANPGDVTVSLAQVFLSHPAKASAAQIEGQKKLATTISQTAANCEDMQKLSRESGATSAGVIRNIKVGSLAEPLRPSAMSLPVGKASEPIQTKDGVVVIMVCERTGDTAPAALPKEVEVRETIGRQRMESLANRYLRDLRRAAFLDVRV
ncbi:MAG TPA: peptidylprolyl isomerase [Alphaproteobacteria bacterium]|jgi:peptidyl-prolyl cis-trans isomerase SurA|nr:peptidylprolyl isomerase [Alphaproteobacteria bacterium]